MRMLTTMFVLALLALPTWAKDEASPPLQEGEALRLLQEAAQISPAYMRTLIAIDRKTARKVVYTQGSDAPLTAAILALAEGGELEAQDFRWLEHATPAEFIAAIHPLDPMQPGSRPKHATANVLHRELVRVLTVTSDGARARGTIEFGKDHIFKGFAHWQAARDRAGRWQVTEIAFRRSHVRVVRVGTRWRLDATGLRSRINRRRGFDLQLPRIGTVGVEPPKDQTILISVTQAAYVHVGDDTTKLSMEALRAVLARRAAPDATREEDGSCKLAVLLDIDASTPWAFVQWIMQTCAHPAVKIHKLYFGVRAASDGAEGTVAVRLPKDRSGPILTTPPPPKIKVKTFFAEREPSDPRALFAALRKVPLAERQAALWELAAPPPHGGKVPHGYILQLLDAMITAGATNIMFEGAAPPLRGAIWSDPEAMAAHIRDLKAIPGHA
ncbi:MAG: hypothetical protein P1V36_10185, partial [Planctomycetota bacterium]|nr:hypothetical protein [Planctomycetota bacterium]